jgi:hypothetical protein
MINLCDFQAYDLAKKLVLAATPNRENEMLSVAELATAGFLSAVPATLITAPVERAKVLLQVSLASIHLVHISRGSAQRYRDKAARNRNTKAFSMSSDTFIRRVASGVYSVGQRRR